MADQEDTVPDTSREHARQIVERHLARGLSVDDDQQLLDSYPDLAPLIEIYLRAARLVEAATGRPRVVAAETVELQGVDGQSTHRIVWAGRCDQCHVDLDFDIASGQARCASCGKSVECELRALDDAMSRQAAIGRFELIERVGEGGFGVVWKAYDPHLDRTVALKVPRQAYVADDVKEFLREARAACQVRHENVVGVYEVGRHGDSVFLVSDFIDGQSLRERLAEQPIAFREIATLIEAICRALQAVHDAGIVHRDLKPGNVLLNRENKPFLTDFGLAKRTDAMSMTTDGSLMGTIEYASPEQLRGEANRADGRSDIYALGVILFELLTGERPFRGSRVRIMQQALTDDPPRVRQLQPRVPRDLETICLKCLEKKPANRFQSAADVADECRRYLRGVPIRSRQISGTTRAYRWCLRNPYPASLLAVICLISIGSVWFAQREKSRSRELVDAKRSAESYAQIADRRARQAEQNERRAQSAAYAAMVSANSYEWDPGTSRRTLADPLNCPPELREFAWRHIMHATDRWPWNGCDPGLLKGHTETITALSFSPDLKYLASCGNDGRIVLWDIATWRPRELRRTTGLVTVLPRLARGVDDLDNVYHIVFTPDGRQLISSDHAGRITLWDVESGEMVRTIVAAGGEVEHLAVSPDGKNIAYTRDGILGLFNHVGSQFILCSLDDPQDKKVLVGHQGCPDTFQFSSDGRHLASGGDRHDKTVRIWDVKRGECVQTIEYGSGVQSLAFFRDNCLLVATTERLEKLFWVENVQVDTFNPQVKYAEHVQIFANDTRIALTDGGRYITVVDAVTGANLTSWELSEAESCRHAAVSPDAKLLAMARDDHAIEIGSITQIGIYRTVDPHSRALICLDYSADSQFIFSGSEDHTLSKTDLATGCRVWAIQLQDPVLGVSVAPQDNIVLACAGDQLVVMRQDDGEILRQWKAHDGSITHCLALPDGRLASCGVDGNLRIWSRGTLAREIPCGVPLRDLAYCPKHGLIAVACDDHTVRVYDDRTGQVRAVLDRHAGGVESVAFDPNGERIFSVAAGEWYVWELSGGELVRRYNTQNGTGIREIRVSPDGKTFVTTQLDPSLWDTRIGARLSIYSEGSDDPCLCVAFAPNGRSMAYGRQSGKVMVRYAIADQYDQL